jgi:hypothetical protein
LAVPFPLAAVLEDFPYQWTDGPLCWVRGTGKETVTSDHTIQYSTVRKGTVTQFRKLLYIIYVGLVEEFEDYFTVGKAC